MLDNRMWKFAEYTNKHGCDYVAALIQHGGTKPGNGKSWGSNERPECHHSIWVWVLSKFLILHCSKLLLMMGTGTASSKMGLDYLWPNCC